MTRFAAIILLFLFVVSCSTSFDDNQKSELKDEIGFSNGEPNGTPPPPPPEPNYTGQPNGTPPPPPPSSP